MIASVSEHVSREVLVRLWERKRVTGLCPGGGLAREAEYRNSSEAEKVCLVFTLCLIILHGDVSTSEAIFLVCTRFVFCSRDARLIETRMPSRAYSIRVFVCLVCVSPVQLAANQKQQWTPLLI